MYKYTKYNTNNILLSYCVRKMFDNLHSLVSLNSERQTHRHTHTHTHIPPQQFYDNSIIHSNIYHQVHIQ